MLKNYISNFIKYKGLLFELVKRDIKVKYKRSVLGLLWSLLNPLLMMLVITIVFSNLFRFDIKNFPIYLLTGQIIFGFMSEATNVALNSILGNGSLIRKVYIPKYMFPLSKVLSSFVNLFFALIAVVIVMAVTRTQITPTVLLFPLSLIYILIFSIGLGLILSASTVFFRDTIYLYGIFLTAWNYFTPVFYPISIIPDKFKAVIYYNPMYYYIEHFREIVLYSKVPSLELNFTCLGISLAFLIIGSFVFYKNQNKFILYI